MSRLRVCINKLHPNSSLRIWYVILWTFIPSVCPSDLTYSNVRLRTGKRRYRTIGNVPQSRSGH
jgi:hypothetical protein